MHRLLFAALCLLLCAPLPAQSATAGDAAWARVEMRDAARSQLPASAIDYGTFAWMPFADVPTHMLHANVQRIDQPFQLTLGGRRFDPASQFPDEVDGWFATSGWSGSDFRLVQFNGPIKPEWIAALRVAGVEPVQFVAPFSYIVWAGPAQIETARTLPQLRFSGEFLPAFRVPESSRLSNARHGHTMALIYREQQAGILAAISQAGAQVVAATGMTRHLSVVELRATPDQFLALARVPGVYTVQEITQDAGPRGEMSNQAVVGGYNASNIVFPGYLHWLTPTGLDGQGVIVGIVDEGIRTSHQDLVSRMVPCVSAGGSPSSCTTSNNSHGTHVAGAVAGTGSSGVVNAAGFLRGLGMAPGASLVQQRYPAFLSDGGPGGMIPDGMLTIFKESALSGALLANNSWGPTGTPHGYDIPTMHIDMITRDANPDLPGAQPLLAVWSIMNGYGDSGGNCAPSSLGSPDEAKNLLAVGSTKLQNFNGTQISAIFDVSANSGHGPACDDRLVPHIVAPGCNTDSTDSGSNTSFGHKCGTSMASPVVSGAVALFVEQYRQTHGGDPSPALVKAVLTATARDLVGNRDADDRVMGHRPDRFQGWGRLDVDRIISPADAVFLLDETELFTASGQSWTGLFQADSIDQPMRIMLAWTDAPGPGTGDTTPAWVNDLDLVVNVGVDTYLGNMFDPDTGLSATGGSADPRNNLEGIVLAPAQHGGRAVSVTVLAANIAADALDPWTPDHSHPRQDFALACVNCEAKPAEASADLWVEKSVDSPIALHGSNVEFTVVAGNAGPLDATSVIVVDPLPSGYSFVSANASVGSYDDVSGLWSIGELEAAAAGGTLEITASVLASGDYQNIALIGGTEGDLNPGNNSASATVIAIDPASTDLSITKEADVSGPGVGDTVVFTLTAANAGPANATGVVVQDLLPPGYAFVSAVASSGSYDENSGEWSIGDIDSGDSETLEITTTVELYDAWMNTATIDGDQDDPFPANNSASASANPDVPLDIFADGFE